MLARETPSSRISCALFFDDSNWALAVSNFCWASTALWLASSKLEIIVFLRSSNRAFKLLPTNETTIPITAAKLIRLVSKMLVLVN